MLGLFGKLAKGVTGESDIIAQLLRAMGCNLEMEPVTPEGVESVFQRAARVSLLSGARVVRITGQMRDGEMVEAVMVLIPSPDSKKGELTTSAPICNLSHA